MVDEIIFGNITDFHATWRWRVCKFIIFQINANMVDFFGISWCAVKHEVAFSEVVNINQLTVFLENLAEFRSIGFLYTAL